jgi:hypothetical protein
LIRSNSGCKEKNRHCKVCSSPTPAFFYPRLWREPSRQIVTHVSELLLPMSPVRTFLKGGELCATRAGESPAPWIAGFQQPILAPLLMEGLTRSTSTSTSTSMSRSRSGAVEHGGIARGLPLGARAKQSATAAMGSGAYQVVKRGLDCTRALAGGGTQSPATMTRPSGHSSRTMALTSMATPRSARQPKIARSRGFSGLA